MEKQLKRKLYLYVGVYFVLKVAEGIIAGAGIYFFFSPLLSVSTAGVISTITAVLWILFSGRKAILRVGELAGAGEELRNAYELMKTQFDGSYTYQLLTLLYRRVLDNLLPFSAYVRKLIPSFIASLLIFGVLYGASLLLPQHTGVERLIEYRGIVEEAMLKVLPPAYIKSAKERRYTITSGIITVPEGSQIFIQLKLREKGTPVFFMCDKKVNNPDKDAEEFFTLRIKNIKEDCELEVRVKRESRILKETPFTFKVKRDEEPEVEIVHPGRNLVLPRPPDNLKVRFFAQDDYGLKKVELVYDIGGGLVKRIAMDLRNSPKSFEDEFVLPVGKFPRGFRISYHVEAEDNDEVNGAKKGFSDTYYIYIPERLTFHEEVMKKIDRLFESTVKLLAVSISGGYEEVGSLVDALEKTLSRVLRDVKRDEHLSLRLLSFLKSFPSKMLKVKEYAKEKKRRRVIEEAENVTYEFFLALQSQTLADAYTIAEEIKELLKELEKAKESGDKEMEKLIAMELEKQFSKLRELAERIPKDILSEKFNPDALKYTGKRSPASYEEMLNSLLKMIENGGRQVSMMGNNPMYEKMRKLKGTLERILAEERLLKGRTEGFSSQCSSEGKVDSGEKMEIIGEQRRIRKETEELAEEWGDQYSALKESSNFMKYSESNMQRENFREAIRGQKMAIERLENLIQSLEDEMRRMKEGWKSISMIRGTGRRGVSGVLNIERVDIPQEVERMETEEIRKEVMRIIKGGLPRKYKEENRKYYEDLVR